MPLIEYIKQGNFEMVLKKCKICKKEFKQEKKSCGRYRETCSQACRVKMIANFNFYKNRRTLRKCEFCEDDIPKYHQQCSKTECIELNAVKVDENIKKYAEGRV